MTSIDLLIQCLLDSKLSWSGQCSPKFTSHVTSCGPSSFVFIQMNLTVVHFVITWGSAFLRCLSVCYIICDYHWFWFSPIAVVGWHADVSNSWFRTSWCHVTDADFITPTLLCLLPLSRLVIFVSIPLHDGCISCRLYNMYLLFLCTDLCPLLR